MVERNCTSKGDERKMKNFILGIIVSLIVGAWVALAVIGIISIKTAILVPVSIIIGALITAWLFRLWWRS